MTWPSVPFPETIRKTSVGRENQIPASEIKAVGRFPVIDQGQSFIAGYSDDESRLITRDLPLVVFGDHTRVIKFVDFPFILGADGTKVLKPRDDFDARFFAFALQSLNLPSRGYNRHFNLLKERSLFRPELAEQRKIAGVLELTQRAIDQQQRLLSLTAELKKSLLHHLFTHGLCNEPQRQTELGPIPQTWEVVKLGDLFGIKHGFAFDGEYFEESGEYILLTPGHFHEDGGFRDQGRKTKYYTGEIPNGYLLQEGDLLVAMTEQKSGLLGSSALIPSKGKFLHNQRLGLIVDLQAVRVDKLFLFYLFNTTPIRMEIAKTSSGSKVRHTSPGKIRNIRIALPSLDEQQNIADTLQAIDAKQDLVRRKHVALSALFHTLLQELMTAHIRVNDLDLTTLSKE